MKNILTAVLLFYFFQIFGQTERFEDLETKINERLLNIKKDDPNLNIAALLISQFKKAGKENKEDFFKINMGISLETQFSNNLEPSYAKFDVKEKKQINIVNFYPFAGVENTENYFNTYLTRFEELGKTKVFKDLLMRKSDEYFDLSGENKNEYIFKDDQFIYFIRGTEDWRFVIAVFKDYQEIEKLDFTVFAFRKTFSGEDIFKSGNSMKEMEARRVDKVSQEKADREKFPLYHDVRTNEIRTLMGDLATLDEKYKTDAAFKKRYEKLTNEKIDRYNVGSFKEDFHYFLTLDLSKYKGAEYGYERDVLNIHHLSAHALADYYLSTNAYQEAIKFYKKSITEFPYEVSSGTTFSKDSERILFDIHKTYYKAEMKDEAYGYLLGLMIDSNNFQETATEKMNEYLENEDRKKFKKDVDEALKTIKIYNQEKYLYSFKFRNKEILFSPFIMNSVNETVEEFRTTEFYKSL